MTHDDQTLLELEHTLYLARFPKLSPAVRAAQAERLERELLAPVNRHHHWRRGTAAIAGFAIVAGTTGVAAAWVTRARPTDTSLVSCFSGATKDFSDVSVQSQVSMVDERGSLEHSATAARELCANLWASGDIASPRPSAAAPEPDNTAVPPLAVCVLPHGGVGVFPNASCLQLSLPAADIALE